MLIHYFFVRDYILNPTSIPAIDKNVITVSISLDLKFISELFLFLKQVFIRCNLLPTVQFINLSDSFHYLHVQSRDPFMNLTKTAHITTNITIKFYPLNTLSLLTALSMSSLNSSVADLLLVVRHCRPNNSFDDNIHSHLK